MTSGYTLEEEVILLQNKGQDRALSLGEIFQILSGKGRTLLFILLSLPFCQPIQIPGLSAPFGLAITFLGLRMSFGKKAWLPKKLLIKTIPPEVLKKVTEKTLFFMRKMRPWVHPRLIGLCRLPFIATANGLMLSALGLLLALPLPIPLSNLTAAWSILLIAFGSLEEDGLWMLVGYFISAMTLLFFLLIAFELVQNMS